MLLLSAIDLQLLHRCLKTNTVCLQCVRTVSEGRRSCLWALPGLCWSPTACSASLCCGRRSFRRAPSRASSSVLVHEPWGERRMDSWVSERDDWSCWFLLYYGHGRSLFLIGCQVLTGHLKHDSGETETKLQTIQSTKTSLSKYSSSMRAIIHSEVSWCRK